MQIHLDSRRKKPATLSRLWPGAKILDVTSKGEIPWVRFSPFFPHGGIPIPNTPGDFAQSVEGLWQGLKVFENEGVDASRWAITNMSGIKRAGRSRGKVLGHRHGVTSTAPLLGYRDARHQIYLPAYRWILEHRLAGEVQQLRELASSGLIVLLDYETNDDVENLASPLSHAALLNRYVEGSWPAKS